MTDHSADIEVIRFRINTIKLTTSDILAHFDVRVGHFTIHDGTLRTPHESDISFIVLPGKRRGKISIAMDAPFRDDILDEVCWLYQAQTNKSLKTKTWP